MTFMAVTEARPQARILCLVFIFLWSATILTFSSTAECASIRPDSEGTGGDLEKADVEEAINKNKDVIRVFKQLKSRILASRTDYSIAKTVGSSVSTAGGVAVVVGLFLSPLTWGASLAFTIGGLVASITGAGTTLTADIVETVKTKWWAEELNRELQSRAKVYDRIEDKIVQGLTWKDYLAKGRDVTSYVSSKLPNAITLGRVMKYFAITAPERRSYQLLSYALSYVSTFDDLGLGRLGKWGEKIIRSTTALKAISVGLAVFGALDTYTIVDTWTTEPKLVTQIDEIVRYLEIQVQALETLRDEF